MENYILQVPESHGSRRKPQKVSNLSFPELPTCNTQLNVGTVRVLNALCERDQFDLQLFMHLMNYPVYRFCFFFSSAIELWCFFFLEFRIRNFNLYLLLAVLFYNDCIRKALRYFQCNINEGLHSTDSFISKSYLK